MQRRVPPLIAQLNGVPQRSFEHQPSAPQDSRGGEVARVAGPLNSLHRRVRERDAQEQMSDLGSDSPSPIVDVHCVRDLCTGRGAALELSNANHAESRGLRRPHQTRPCRTIPRASRLGHEGDGSLTSIRSPGLKPAGTLLGGPFVYAISVFDLNRA